MRLFDGTNPNSDKFGAGLDGFQDKNAGGGIGGSKPDEAWLDMVQYEIANCIRNQGGTLVTAATPTFPDDYEQLWEFGCRPGKAAYGYDNGAPLVINGADVTLTADLYATTIDFLSNHRLITNGYRVFAYTHIKMNGNTAGIVPAASLDASGSTGGSGAGLGTLASSAAGSNGLVGAGTAGTNQIEAVGADGGAGGAGDGGAGGAGGSVSAIPATSGSINDIGGARNMLAFGATTNTVAKGAASGGAGAGNGAAASGGGGGGAAPTGVIAAPLIELGAAGFINWDGGAGGDGDPGNTGGGGGGGGGFLAVITRVIDAPAQCTAAGGAAGSGQGTGSDGVAGDDGTVAFLYA